LTAEIADGLFGIAPLNADQEKQPRLGIAVEEDDGKVRVGKVMDGSIAQHAGLRQHDIIESMAGERVAVAADVVAMIGRTAPGTWLPITVRRGSEQVEVVARFPPRKPK
jgi:S1-C subfamily serine protease